MGKAKVFSDHKKKKVKCFNQYFRSLAEKNSLHSMWRVVSSQLMNKEWWLLFVMMFEPFGSPFESNLNKQQHLLRSAKRNVAFQKGKSSLEMRSLAFFS